jgi:hypothetical protein
MSRFVKNFATSKYSKHWRNPSLDYFCTSDFFKNEGLFSFHLNDFQHAKPIFFQTFLINYPPKKCQSKMKGIKILIYHFRMKL